MGSRIGIENSASKVCQSGLRHPTLLRDVLLTSLEMLIQDKSVAAGKDSALEDSIEKSEFAVLKALASKLQAGILLSVRGADPCDSRMTSIPAAIYSGVIIEHWRQTGILSSSVGIPHLYDKLRRSF